MNGISMGTLSGLAIALAIHSLDYYYEPSVVATYG